MSTRLRIIVLIVMILSSLILLPAAAQAWIACIFNWCVMCVWEPDLEGTQSPPDLESPDLDGTMAHYGCAWL